MKKIELILIILNLSILLWLIIINYIVIDNYNYIMRVIRATVEDIGKDKHKFRMLLSYLKLECDSDTHKISKRKPCH